MLDKFCKICKVRVYGSADICIGCKVKKVKRGEYTYGDKLDDWEGLKGRENTYHTETKSNSIKRKLQRLKKLKRVAAVQTLYKEKFDEVTRFDERIRFDSRIDLKPLREELKDKGISVTVNAIKKYYLYEKDVARKKTELKEKLSYSKRASTYRLRRLEKIETVQKLYKERQRAAGLLHFDKRVDLELLKQELKEKGVTISAGRIKQFLIIRDVKKRIAELEREIAEIKNDV